MLELSVSVVGTLVRAAGATLLFVAILLLLTVVFRRLYRRIDNLRESRRLSVSVQQLELIRANQVAEAVLAGARLTRVIAVLASADLYLSYVLGLFPQTEPLSQPLLLYLAEPLRELGSAFFGYLPELVYIVVVVVAVHYSLRLIHFLFRAIENGVIVIRGFHRDWAETTYKLVRAFAYLITLINIFPHLPGANEEFFRGALVTLGSTSAIGNAAAGLVLTYTRSFQMGDWIEIDNIRGAHRRRLAQTHRESDAAGRRLRRQRAVRGCANESVPIWSKLRCSLLFSYEVPCSNEPMESVCHRHSVTSGC